ncbi:hypothetical protein U724_15610 [Pseudomonas chlororaphis subsp. aurantiaca PB-St2]|nr:hypothetical protein U724_15610 [Pseudomonas chlororaphis subsp. aurantiaca PB-St2]
MIDAQAVYVQKLARQVTLTHDERAFVIGADHE